MIAALALLWPLASGAQELPPDLARIAARKTLVVALNSEDAPPYFFRDRSGRLAGIDVDLARLIARALGVQARFVRRTTSFDDLVAMAARGEADVALSALYPTPERARGAIFSRPYLKIPRALIVNRKRAASRFGAVSWAAFDTAEARVGLYDSPVFDRPCRRRFPATQLRRYGFDQRAALIRDLLAGDLDAVCVDGVEEDKWRRIVKDFDLYLYALRDPNDPFSVCAAVGWRSEHLARWLDVFIEALDRDGTLADLARRDMRQLP